MRFAVILLSVFIFYSCSNGSPLTTGGSTNNPSGGNSAPYEFSGIAQKGPILQGSEISVMVYDDNLDFVERISGAAVLDDRGSFSFPELGGRYADVTVRGYFQDELTGELSRYLTSLSAYVDLSYYHNWSVNLLSTLAKSRVIYLVEQEGWIVIDAIRKAYKEVLFAFGIETEIDMATANVLEDDEAASILIAISVATLQLSENRATYTGGGIYEMHDFINEFQTDLKVDGLIGATYGLAEQIRLAANAMDAAAVRASLENIRTQLDVLTAVPDFEKFIDFDGDGLLQFEDDDTPSMTPVAEILGLDYEQEYTTDPVIVSGIHPLGYSWLETNWDMKTIINDVPVDGTKFAVVNGDTIAFSNTSAAFGETKDYSYTIGTESYNFSVSTYTPITIVATNVNRGFLSADGQTAYLSYSGGFSVYDLSSGDSQELGKWSAAPSATDIHVNQAGTVAYLSDTAYGIYAVDISNPSAITQIGNYSNGTENMVLDEVNGRLVTSQREKYWSVFDVNADGSLANQVDFSTAKPTYGVAYSQVLGIYAVLADDYSTKCSVYIYDSSDFSFISEYVCQDSKSTNFAKEIEFSHDGLKLILSGGSAFEIVDVSVPSSPTLIAEKESFADYVVFGPGDEHVFAATSGGLDIFSLADVPVIGDPIREYGYYPLEHLVFSANAERVFMVKSSRESYVIDLADMVY